MSVTSAQSGPPAASAARPAKRARGEGQWALGHREPLNPNERTKKDDDGLNVRARIENVYAKRGFDSIDPADRSAPPRAGWRRSCRAHRARRRRPRSAPSW